MQSSQDSTLLSFRRVIAAHLSSVLSLPTESLLPLVQQNTGARKPSHSVFSVVIKRLTGGKDLLDEAILEKCLELSVDTQKWIAAVRRTVLAGCVARILMRSGQQSVKVIMSQPTSNEMDVSVKDLCRGLDLTQEGSSTVETETYLATIKSAFESNKEIAAQIKEDGSWIVDLTAHQLGQVKVFTMSSDGGGAQAEPTMIVQTLVSMAHHFSEHECHRYLWLVPDGKRQFAEQLLFLAKAIFSINTHAAEEEEHREKRTTTTGQQAAMTWAEKIEVLHYGVATGADIWKNNIQLPTGLAGIIKHTNSRMREIIVENRGRPGVGIGYGESDDDLNGVDDEPALDEAELKRMAKILTESALAFASVGGKRIRRLNVDMSRIMDGKGNSGVFLQYVHSRLCGIQRKANAPFNPDADLSLVKAYPEALNLCLVIADWQDTLLALQETLDPYSLTSYLFRLAAEIGQANRVLRVKDMESPVAEARWLLFWSAKQVLEQGLRLLGLEFVEHM
ncbi:Arginyl-tRNA synthetase [Mortierella claussenii]|nr:Arginyl-tRNA synthetase [Mortierella claussenii]